MILLHLKETIADAISAAAQYNVTPADLLSPPKPEMGDISYPCFAMAKEKKISPADLAKEIVKELSAATLVLVDRVEATGPYVNVHLDTARLAGGLSDEILKEGDRYGWHKEQTKKIIFEYSGLNTHKEVHIGHVRNHALGASIIQLLRSQGNMVIPVNFVNDFGMNVAKCIWGLQKFHGGGGIEVITTEEATKMETLADIYAEASAKMEGDDAARAEVDAVLKAIEDDPNSPEHALWRKTRDWSMAGFEVVYNEMDLEFDSLFFESDVKHNGKAKVDALLSAGVVKKSQGAIIADLEEYNLGVLLLLKSDGTGLYSTTDLALVDAKFERYPEASTSIVLTDIRQGQYFAQLYKVLELSGMQKELVHIGYDFVTLPDGMMSSRTGTVIRHRDLRDALIARAQEEIVARHPDWNAVHVQAVARDIAMGAMKFTMVSVGSNQQIVFDMDSALSLHGFSSVALQYAGARLHGILSKVGVDALQKVEWTNDLTAVERKIMIHLLWYPEVLAQAAAHYDPSHIARFAYELAQMVGTFYESSQVIDDSGEVHHVRLALVQVMSEALKDAMEILGVPYLEQM